MFRTTHELVFLAVDVGDIHVVGGGGQILKLLLGEDIDGNDVDLGVTVLASLGGGHLNDLAGAALDDNVTVLAQSRALHGVGGRGAGIGGLEGLVLLSVKISELAHDQDDRGWSKSVAKYAMSAGTRGVGWGAAIEMRGPENTQPNRASRTKIGRN